MLLKIFGLNLRQGGTNRLIVLHIEPANFLQEFAYKLGNFSKKTVRSIATILVRVFQVRYGLANRCVLHTAKGVGWIRRSCSLLDGSILNFFCPGRFFYLWGMIDFFYQVRVYPLISALVPEQMQEQSVLAALIQDCPLQ